MGRIKDHYHKEIEEGMHLVIDNIEFLYVSNGAIEPSIYLKNPNEQSEWLKFKDCDDLMVREFVDRLLKDEKARKAFYHLNGIYKVDNNSEKLRIVLQQFIKCNFAALDDKVDITPQKLNYEYVQCLNRGIKCPYKGEGTVCIKTKPD